MQLRTGNSRLLGQLLVLLLLGACHAQLDEVHEDSEREAWLAGVFTPRPLMAAPWQQPTPTPTPAPTASVRVPDVGQVQGRAYKLLKNRPVDAYLGLRYGQVTGGLGRFQPARVAPYQPFINATQSSPNCAQFPEVQRLQAAEARGENVDDCLTLNIYAPSAARNLPVLVFVHGEMLFDGGAEEAQPDYVLEHDVVLVSINYRLAPFGFLTSLTDELPGNVALSDLQLALEWVQRNIRYFGGDSSKTTIIGQAGGATLAHALSLSPKTQHLFQQLILQSGTALNPYLIDERPLETLATFAQLARCPSAGRSLAPLYECLRRMRTSQLVAAFEQLLQQNEPRGLSALGGFKLVVGDRLGYLPAHPAALVASNSVNNITKPSIVGAAKDASAFILSRFYNQISSLQSQNISDYINVVLRHTAPADQHRVWHDWALREIYTPEQLRYVTPRSVTQGLLELSNLILYRAPVVYSIRLSYKKSPTYLYTFDYRGEHHRFGHLENPLPFGVDASLSDDSVYLFPYPEEASNLNPEDKSLARALVAMWVSFAQTGIPNENANVWPRASSEYGPFLRFTNSRHSILELDQHFGEGINVPDIYAQYSITTTTTTTTTRRPYPYYPRPTYRQPQQQDLRPAAGSREEEIRRQSLLRQQQERELKLREQLEREKLQQEQLSWEEEERKREQLQRESELRREQQLRGQLEQEQRLREQQQREQAARLRQEQLEQEEREQQQRELERQEKEREQQQREQFEREQQERAQQPQLVPELTEHQQRVQQEADQQELEEREQESKEQREREQQQREQLEREQQERSQQLNPSNVDSPPDPDAYPTYEEYVKAFEQWATEQNNRYNPESYASAEQQASAESAPASDPYAQPDRDPVYAWDPYQAAV